MEHKLHELNAYRTSTHLSDFTLTEEIAELLLALPNLERLFISAGTINVLDAAKKILSEVFYLNVASKEIHMQRRHLPNY